MAVSSHDWKPDSGAAVGTVSASVVSVMATTMIGNDRVALPAFPVPGALPPAPQSAPTRVAPHELKALREPAPYVCTCSMF